MKRVTLKAINAALPPGVELCKGAGYFYFCGGDAEAFEEAGVYGGVTRLSDLTVAEWRAEYDSKRRLAVDHGYLAR